jgi:hypothetical protein
MTRRKPRFKVGDYVYEIDDTSRVSIVIRILKDPGLIIVRFPPRQDGVVFHPDDLVKL